MSIFAIFVVELVSHRWGSSYLQKRGITIIDPRSKSDKILSGESSATASMEEDSEKKMGVEAETGVTHGVDHQIDYADSPMSKIVGIAILEFGIIFHSMILGLLLAVEEDFVILFIVLIFHRKISHQSVNFVLPAGYY
jgi:zinc transporter 1/2/3